MLDTNTVSHLLRGHPMVVKRVVAKPIASLCVSAITVGELMFGLARRPEARRLHLAVNEFLRRVDVLAWDGGTADHYGALRAKLESVGRSLGPLDMLIASHAKSVGAILVSNDKAFVGVSGLKVQDWTT